MENLKIDSFYRIADEFYLKVDKDGMIHISYYNDLFILNVKEHLESLMEKNTEMYIPYLKDIIDKGMSNFTNDPGLPKNYYLEFNVETLKEILNKAIEHEDYERCDKIKKVIDFKVANGE